MRELLDFHHYRADTSHEMDIVSKYEKYVAEKLLKFDVSEETRESSTIFELKHHHSTLQFARLLARKRNLPVDVCSVGALLHDIYVIETGAYSNHARNGVPYAQKILDEIGGFGNEKTAQILNIIGSHSDKHIFSDDPFSEFGKDVDILDCFLYPGAFGFYLKHKPHGIFVHYVSRAKSIWNELGIHAPTDFDVLDNYEDNWLSYRVQVDKSEANTVFDALFGMNENSFVFGFTIPTVCLRFDKDKIEINVNKKSWDAFVESFNERFQANVKDIYELAKIYNKFRTNIDVAGVVSAHNNNAIFSAQGSMSTNSKLALKSRDGLFANVAEVVNGCLVLIWAAINAYEFVESSNTEKLIALGVGFN
jgi:hypothetical protein